MRKQYKEVLNEGNEALQIGKSISVEESPRGVASRKDIAKHIEAKSHGMINEGLAEMFLGFYGETVIDLVGTEDLRVPLYGREGQYGQFYCDMRLDKNISEAEARTIKPELGNAALTKDNISGIVNAADIQIRFKFETEKKGTDALKAAIEGVEKVGSLVKPYIARKENQGGTQGGGTNPQNPNDNGELG